MLIGMVAWNYVCPMLISHAQGYVWPTHIARTSSEYQETRTIEFTSPRLILMRLVADESMALEHHHHSRPLYWFFDLRLDRKSTKRLNITYVCRCRTCTDDSMRSVIRVLTWSTWTLFQVNIRERTGSWELVRRPLVNASVFIIQSNILPSIKCIQLEFSRVHVADGPLFGVDLNWRSQTRVGVFFSSQRVEWNVTCNESDWPGDEEKKRDPGRCTRMIVKSAVGTAISAAASWAGHWRTEGVRWKYLSLYRGHFPNKTC